jgi:heme-degrading monooxygenase HmoA
MFATVRRYQGTPGQTEETIRRVQQGLVPILTKQPGFVSYHAIEATNDVAVSVTIYADRASAEAGNQAAVAWARQNLVGLVGPAEVTIGEVRIATSAERV